MNDTVRPSTDTTKPRPMVRARPFCAAADGSQAIGNLLTPAEQATLAGIATTLRYPAGDAPIYAEGDEARALFAIDSGLVRIARHGVDGSRHVLGFLRPGDLFGLAEDGRYVNSAETLTPATLLSFPLQRLTQLLVEDARLQLHLLTKAAHDLRTAQRQLVLLGQQDIHHRLASFLIDFCGHPDFYEPAGHMLTLPMTRLDIGDYLGTSAETVARNFGRLEQEGVLTRITPKRIQIRDMAQLMRLASGRAG